MRAPFPDHYCDMIEIVSPTTGVKKSPEAFYNVICEETAVPGGLSIRDTGAPVQRRPGKSKQE